MNLDLSSIAQVEISGPIDPDSMSCDLDGKNIKTLVIRDTCLSDKHLESIEKCKKLESLILIDCEVQSTYEAFPVLLGRKKICELAAINCRKDEFLKGIVKCASVSHLAIKQMIITPPILDQMIRMHALQEVDFEGSSIPEKELIEFICNRSKQLSVFSLAEVSSVSGKVLEALFACENLQYLDLSKALSKKGDSTETLRLKQLFLCLRRTLRHISVKEAVNITGEVLEKGIQRVNDLETIDLSGCPNLSDDDLYYLVPRLPPLNILPHLKVVKVVNCTKITPQYLEFLKKTIPEVSYISQNEEKTQEKSSK
jgi:hypothetical protein